MAYRLTKTGALAYVPAVQAVPASPARCVTTARTTSERILIQGASYGQNAPSSVPTNPPVVVFTDASLGVGRGETVAFPVGGGSGGGGSQAGGFGGRVSTPAVYETRYTTTHDTMCYPAVEAVPGRPGAFVDTLEGWTGGANSYALLAADGYVALQIDSLPVGALFGLAASNNSNGFGEAEHAFYVTGNIVHVVERGQIKVSTAVGDYTGGVAFYISRNAGQVTYSIAGTSFSYESGVASTGAKTFDVSLYSIGDSVASPVIGEVGVATLLSAGSGIRARVRRIIYRDDDALRGYSDVPGEALAYATSGIRAYARLAVDGQFYEAVGATSGISASAGAYAEYPLTVGDGTGIRASAEGAYYLTLLPAWVGRGGDYEYGEVVAATAPWQLASDSTFEPPSVPRIVAAVPPYVLGAVMYSGGVATVDHTLRAWDGLSGDYDYTEVDAVTPAWYGFAFDRREAPGYQAWLEPLWAVDWYIRPARVYATFTSSLDLASTFEAVVTITADLMDGLSLADDWTLSRALSAMIAEGVAFSSSVDPTELEAIQYALNLATGGVSRYTGYDFLGYCEANNTTFGWDNGAVYALDGDGDDGEGVSTLVDLGQVDLGTLASKHIDGLFLGVDTDGTVYARLQADNKAPQVYRARQRDRSTRVDVGKGATARQWNVTFEVVDATEVDIDSIEFLISVASRRWVR